MLTSDYIIRLAKAYAIRSYKDNMDNEESKTYWIGVYRQLCNIESLDIKMREEK